ncbi:hypothetical protein WDJ50_00960 [Deinococcus sp. VB142]|uniref:Uncharacterized protein n=1 Tax=Deinococcus sp. VB142 TaxID=3112952 RepID=A0AAU6Q264_9DEIO
MSWLRRFRALTDSRHQAISTPCLLGLVAKTAPVFRAAFGDKAMVQPFTTASEDFSVYGQDGKVPLLFFFVGAQNPEKIKEAAATGKVLPYTDSAKFLHSRNYTACASISRNPYLFLLLSVGLNPEICWIQSESVLQPLALLRAAARTQHQDERSGDESGRPELDAQVRGTSAGRGYGSSASRSPASV